MRLRHFRLNTIKLRLMYSLKRPMKVLELLLVDGIKASTLAINFTMFVNYFGWRR